jgi:hypothetical protein
LAWNRFLVQWHGGGKNDEMDSMAGMEGDSGGTILVLVKEEIGSPLVD